MTSHVPPQRPAPQNQLLARLGVAEGRRLLARCETVQLRPADVLSEPGAPMRHVYFPLQGFISMVAMIEGDRGVEVGMVGNEGMLGSQVVLGVAAAPFHALVQGPGTCLRMGADTLRSELARSPALVGVLHRYVYVQMAQMAISAGCLRFHLIGPRLARWLLMTHDRAHADGFGVTQEFLAYMLGVRRAGVSAAAGALQQRGLIHYRRGSFTVLDRRGLEAMACSCYAAGQRSHAEMLA
ncbi:Crp/Fnr family transcriptional regulator [Pseudorhodoferax sp. Leaf274]|uniref:Crp/Fnr family transcriptional regulator n=1 Tax=Pseudorhodoferax sp. Leaf274 TaxID=1736318 RepID=UPI0007026745|nr:Crp/Fnr family transcriptional regulator [Pseudorhodoferax sp. Leaf274]KQP35849.1 Crp/Fnr family transcriptional regulator [Pseudorhodoferax sp. Leaf274]